MPKGVLQLILPYFLMFRLGVLNPDGKCKCFDEEANGYTRSEAVCVVLLQKSKDARRIYAEVQLESQEKISY